MQLDVRVVPKPLRYVHECFVRALKRDDRVTRELAREHRFRTAACTNIHSEPRRAANMFTQTAQTTGVFARFVEGARPAAVDALSGAGQRIEDERQQNSSA